MGHTWFLCSRTGNDGNSDSWARSLHPGAPVSQELGLWAVLTLETGALQHEMGGLWWLTLELVGRGQHLKPLCPLVTEGLVMFPTS